MRTYSSETRCCNDPVNNAKQKGHICGERANIYPLRIIYSKGNSSAEYEHSHHKAKNEILHENSIDMVIGENTLTYNYDHNSDVGRHE